ncbi:MAG: nuclear transport factor 2 family protein [Comamonadaceae bacterium]|nr:MAG: nuclear transport factor 2 family protein [Comamonadaceae bacterium]
MHDSELWAIEEQLWTAGEDVYRQRLDKGALMVLPSYGVLDHDAVLALVKQRPCSRRVVLDDRISFLPAGDVGVLAYNVFAVKRDGSHQRGRCKSTYVRIAGQWFLAMHQQTSAHDPFDDDTDLGAPAPSMAARVLGSLVGRSITMSTGRLPV